MRKQSILAPKLPGASPLSHSVLAYAGAVAPHGLPFIYLTVKDVAEAIGRSAPTIYKLVAAGKFPQGDLIDSNTRRWRSDVVARWLQETADRAESEREHADAHIKRRAQASIAARRNRCQNAGGAQ